MANPRNNPVKYHPDFPWVPIHYLQDTKWPYPYAPGSAEDKEQLRKITERIERTDGAIRKGLQKCGIPYNENEKFLRTFMFTPEQRSIVIREMMIADGWVTSNELPEAPGQKLKNEDEDVKMREAVLRATDGIPKTARPDLQEEDEDVKMKE